MKLRKKTTKKKDRIKGICEIDKGKWFVLSLIEGF